MRKKTSTPAAAVRPAQVAARSHPDLVTVARPADKATIPLELLIGDKEHRMRDGLCHDIALTPFMGKRKVAIIDDADYLNIEGANSLLKTLEEPPPRSVLILVGTTPAKQLPTIRSRCQIVRFAPLGEEALVRLLVRTGLDAAEASRLARDAGGSLQRAAQMRDASLWEFRSHLFASLCGPLVESPRLAAAVQSLVEAAGREAPPRRARLHQVIDMAVDFYRHLLRVLSTARLGPMRNWPGTSPRRRRPFPAAWKPLPPASTSAWRRAKRSIASPTRST